MPIIRRQNFVSAPPFSFEDMHTRVAAAEARAQARADVILAEAERAAAALQERARAEAFERGLAEGRAAALEKALAEKREQLKGLFARLDSALKGFERDKRGMLAAAERGVIELALAIAERVCKLQAGRGGDVARANVRALLDLVRHEADVQLALHPADLAALERGSTGEFAALQALQHVRIAADESVGQGGCEFRMQSGSIDARLETQIRRISESLLDGQVPVALSAASEAAVLPAGTEPAGTEPANE